MFKVGQFLVDTDSDTNYGEGTVTSVTPGGWVRVLWDAMNERTKKPIATWDLESDLIKTTRPA